MKTLTAAKRRRMAAKAAKLLKRKTVHWTTGRWIQDLASGAECAPDHSMGVIRKWWKDHGLDTFNKECNVCLEGALLLAAIEDKDIPDTMRGDQVLSQFQNDILNVGHKYVDGHWNEIPGLNDQGLRYHGEAKAIEILEEAGRPAGKVSDGT